jgi:hypothetical protein
MKAFGGEYVALRDDRGFLGSKAGGRVVVEIPSAIPLCKECGKEMSLIFQVPFSESDGGGFVGALIFMCDSEDETCSTWEPSSGANAVVLLKDWKSREPFGMAAYPAFEIRWVEFPDLSAEITDLSDDDPQVKQVESEIEAFVEKFGWSKMGGLPLWYQNPEVPTCVACGGPTQFLGQFDSQLGKDASGADAAMNFGDAGIGYAFLCEKRCSDQGGAFLWQCA